MIGESSILPLANEVPIRRLRDRQERAPQSSTNSVFWSSMLGASISPNFFDDQP